MNDAWDITKRFFEQQIAMDRERLRKPTRVETTVFESKDELALDLIRIEMERGGIVPGESDDLAHRVVEQMKRGGLL